MFLEDMDKLESNYRPTFDSWKQDPSPVNTSRLLTQVKPEIERGIKAHVGKSNPLLYSRAKRMALQAMETYDPKRAKLGTHIINQLQGLKRVARQQTQVLRVPERVSLDQTRVEQARNELLDDLGRDPNLTELADYTGLSIKRLAYLKRFKMPAVEGAMSEPVEPEGAAFMPAVEQLGGRNPWLDVVHSDLDRTNQKIMEWTLGLYGEPVMSNQDIARRLRISPGAVSQRKSVIQSMLDKGERLSPF